MPSNPTSANPTPPGRTSRGTGRGAAVAAAGAVGTPPTNGAPGTPSAPAVSSNPNQAQLQNIENNKANIQQTTALNNQGEPVGDMAKTKEESNVTIYAGKRKWYSPSKTSLKIAKLQVEYPYSNAPLGSFLQKATVKVVAYSKDIRKTLILASDKVEAANEVDLCNLISYFLTQALPSGSNVEKQFQEVKKKATDALEKIEESESKITNFPLKKASIPSGSQVYATNSNIPSPSPTNIAAQNSGYGGGGTFNNPPTPSPVQSSTGGNSGTSAQAQIGRAHV